MERKYEKYKEEEENSSIRSRMNRFNRVIPNSSSINSLPSTHNIHFDEQESRVNNESVCSSQLSCDNEPHPTESNDALFQSSIYDDASFQFIHPGTIGQAINSSANIPESETVFLNYVDSGNPNIDSLDSDVNLKSESRIKHKGVGKSSLNKRNHSYSINDPGPSSSCVKKRRIEETGLGLNIVRDNRHRISVPVTSHVQELRHDEPSVFSQANPSEAASSAWNINSQNRMENIFAQNSLSQSNSTVPSNTDNSDDVVVSVNNNNSNLQHSLFYGRKIKSYTPAERYKRSTSLIMPSHYGPSTSKIYNSSSVDNSVNSSSHRGGSDSYRSIINQNILAVNNVESTGMREVNELQSQPMIHCTSSPINSPNSPGDDCLVSSSTGHLDSIPPSPECYQGNNVSCPSSPSAMTSGAQQFILDSTIDSTSGQIFDDEHEDLNFDATDAPEISTSDMNLSVDGVQFFINADDFSSRNQEVKFIEQCCLALNDLEPNTVESSLANNKINSHMKNEANQHLNNHLHNDKESIPGPSTSYHHSSRISPNQYSVSSPSDLSIPMAPPDSELSLGGLENNVGVSLNSVHESLNNMPGEEFNSLSTNKILPLESSFDLSINKSSNNNMNETSHFSSNFKQLKADLLENNSSISEYESVSNRTIITNDQNKFRILEKALSDPKENDSDLSGRIVESQNLLTGQSVMPSRILQEPNNQVSLMVSEGVEGNDAFLMMVSDAQCINPSLELGENLAQSDSKSVKSENFDIASISASLHSFNPSISNCSILNDEADNLKMSLPLSHASFTLNNNMVYNSIINITSPSKLVTASLCETNITPLIYTNSNLQATSETTTFQDRVNQDTEFSMTTSKKDNKHGSKFMPSNNSHTYLSTIGTSNDSSLNLSYKNEDIFNNSTSKSKVLNDYSVVSNEDFTQDITSILSDNSNKSRRDIPSKTLKVDLETESDRYISLSLENSNESNLSLTPSPNLSDIKMENTDSNLSEPENKQYVRRVSNRIKLNQSDSLSNDSEISFKSLLNSMDKTYPNPQNKQWMQSVNDKKIFSRARASLPNQHLIIRTINDKENLGVFSKRKIHEYTRFGPLTGVLENVENFDDVRNKSPMPFFLKKNDNLCTFNISDENTSNWMRFVRKADNFMEINCIVVEEKEEIYFLTCELIKPHTELRVGYSQTYSEKYKLPFLKPTKQEEKLLQELKKSWSCFDCDEVFETSSEFQNHLSIHDENITNNGRHTKKKAKKKTKIKIFNQDKKIKTRIRAEGEFSIHRCAICTDTYPLKKLAELHRLGHVDDMQSKDDSSILNSIEDRQCPSCDQMFESLEELCKHVSIHKNVRENGFIKSYRCDQCSKCFPSTEKLKAHSTTHMQNEQVFSCNICMKVFSSSNLLATHHKTHKSDSKTYDCPICRALFSRIVSLRNHVTTHCIDGYYTCPTCKKKFHPYKKIRRHIRNSHSLTIHKCPHCQKEMPSMGKLKTHLLTHSDQRAFACNLCDSRFKRKDKLNDHKKRMHLFAKIKPNTNPKKFLPKVDPADYQQFNYKCRLCLLGFKRRGMLVNHMANRHPGIPTTSVPELNQPIIKNNYLYKCQHCNKVYKSSNKRKLHILKIHPGAEIPPSNSYLAPVEEQFGVSESSVVQSYAMRCDRCHKEYATNAKLLQHRRREHNIDSTQKVDVYRCETQDTNNGLKADFTSHELQDSVSKRELITSEFANSIRIATVGGEPNVVDNSLVSQQSRVIPITREKQGEDGVIIAQPVGDTQGIYAIFCNDGYIFQQFNLPSGESTL